MRKPAPPRPPVPTRRRDLPKTPTERLRALRPAPVTPSVPAGRLWRRMGIVAAMVAVIVLSQHGRFQDLSDRVFGARIDWASDYRMTDYLYGLIERHHLAGVPRACLLLNIHGGDPADATHLDVYERPTAPCLGARHDEVRFLPRLFGLLVDRTRGHVLTDQGSPGRYHPLPWL